MTNDADPLGGQQKLEEFRAARARFLARFSGNQMPDRDPRAAERAQSLVAAWNAHDPEEIAFHYASRGVRHQLALPEIRLVGRADIAIGVGVIIHGLPDCSLEVETQLAGDTSRSILEWTLTGTHDNDFLGLPASGARVRLPGMSIFAFNDSWEIAIERVYWDAATLMAYAGVLE